MIWLERLVSLATAVLMVHFIYIFERNHFGDFLDMPDLDKLF